MNDSHEFGDSSASEFPFSPIGNRVKEKTKNMILSSTIFVQFKLLGLFNYSSSVFIDIFNNRDPPNFIT